MESSIQEEVERTLRTLPPELGPAIRSVPFVKTISDIGAYYRLTAAELNALAKESARFVAGEHTSQSFIQAMVQAFGNDRMKTAAVIRKARVALFVPLIQQMKSVFTSPPPEPRQPKAAPGAVPVRPAPPPRPLPMPSLAAGPRVVPVPQPRPPAPPPPVPRPPPEPQPLSGSMKQEAPNQSRFQRDATGQARIMEHELRPPPRPIVPPPPPLKPPPVPGSTVPLPKPAPPAPQEPQPPQPLIIYPLTKTPIPLPSRPPQSPTPLEHERVVMPTGTPPAPTIGPSGIRPSSPEPSVPNERPPSPTPPSPYVIRKEELQKGNAGSATAPPPNLPTTGQEPPPPPAEEHYAADPYREPVEE